MTTLSLKKLQSYNFSRIGNFSVENVNCDHLIYNLGKKCLDTLTQSIEITTFPPCTMSIGTMLSSRMLDPSTLWGKGVDIIVIEA